jgi:hypothetical protein
MSDSAKVPRPSFKEGLRFWFKLGWISLGGTAAHIAIMHDDLVEKKRWILRRLDAISLGWVILSFVLLRRFKVNVIHLILPSVGVGLIRYLLSL